LGLTECGTFAFILNLEFVHTVQLSYY
jgi:hypothetical protein